MRRCVLLFAVVLGGCSNAPDTSVAVDCAPLAECDPELPNWDKGACDDGDPGTADRCIDLLDGGAACAHVEVECDSADPPTVQASVCDDGDPCTGERCRLNACVHSPIGNCLRP